MGKPGPKSRRVGAIIAALATLAAIIILLWKVPQIQTERATNIGGATQRIRLENELRRTMATVLAGAFVLISGFLAWLNIRIAQENLTVMQQNLVVTREGQITDRFTKAIEHLGARHTDGTPLLELRLGGIFALERIAQDSPERDHGPIMEVLTAYVRSYVREPALPPTYSNEATPSEQDSDEEIEPRPDVQAILTVLGRRSREQRKHESRPLDLVGSDLRGASLGFANLEGATFAYARLTGAHLRGAHLEGANFFGAYLGRAYLREAHLEGATLDAAYLKLVDLKEAHLENATLINANLAQAKLDNARLEGADLRVATGLIQAQIDVTYMDEATKLPKGSDVQALQRSTRKPPSRDFQLPADKSGPTTDAIHRK